MLNNRAFSLIELMISMALGLLLIGGLTTVFVQVLGSNSASLRVSELNEELTAAMNLMVGDIRRGGYGMYQNKDFQQPLIIANHPQEIANSCVLFTYDHNNNGEHDGNEEWFGYRLRDGQIQRRRNGNLCDAKGWEGLTQKDAVYVGELSFDKSMVEPLQKVLLRISLTMTLVSNPKIKRTRATRLVLPYAE